MDRRSFSASTWLFLRVLGFIYFAAFVSFGLQVPGLIGSNGILPADRFMVAVAQHFGGTDISALPTLCWFSATDGFLAAQWIIGAIVSALVMVGVGPPPMLAVLWLLYLSLVTIGRDFMAFQWDNLLLEVGFLAIFIAPWRLWSSPKRLATPPRVTVRLAHWLLFRVIFSSGVVKFTSGDDAWNELQALTAHFETQPLPTWFGYYWHQLPAWWHGVEVVGVIVGQVFLPFLIWGPVIARRVAAAGIIGFQVLIAATGNYGFFNLLTVAMALLLLDDGLLVRGRLASWFESVESTVRGGTYVWWGAIGVAAVPIIVASSLIMARTLGVSSADSAGAQAILQPIRSFRSVNPYGLFAVMTMSRPEIIIEGSHDGVTWLAYEFRYKPGDLDRRPEFVAPHMPRLDWQMWFAALGSARQNRWFGAFVQRLLEGAPQVLDLLAHDPFADAPPRFVRAVTYDYRFTALGSDVWWRRTEKGIYLPPQSLR